MNNDELKMLGRRGDHGKFFPLIFKFKLRQALQASLRRPKSCHDFDGVESDIIFLLGLFVVRLLYSFAKKNEFNLKKSFF